jgi:hypothetical protein
MEVVTDVAALDVELLQLPDVSTLFLKSNLTFVETLFDQWLSVPDTNRLVRFVFFFSLYFEINLLLLLLLFMILIV